MYQHLTVAVAVILVVTLTWGYLYIKAQKKKFAELESKITELQTQMTNSEDRARHLLQVLGELQSQQIEQSGAMQQIQQVCDLQQSLSAELQNKIQLLESQNDENKLYQRAKKLFELGADVEEVMTECGVSKSEAELLLSLSQQG